MRPMMRTSQPRKTPLSWKLNLALGATTVGLTVILILLVNDSRRATPPPNSLLDDPEVFRAVVADLVAETGGIFDSHVDPDVGRVLLPNLAERQAMNSVISTNRRGMRESEWQVPKPPGKIRIVFLGDSMVFGIGVDPDQRMGALLEQRIVEKNPSLRSRIECLHLGIVSWNIKAEVAYLRRQLSQLEPDLVFHVVVPNDIEDSSGVRGFGGPSRFSAHVRDRGDSMITASHSMRVLGSKRYGLLRFGLDWEARTRYRSAALDLSRLARAVEEQGGRYRLVAHFRDHLPVARSLLATGLPEDQVLYVSRRFGDDRLYWVSPNDPHWNPDGHAQIARALYQAISLDELLPGITLPAWKEAEEAYEEIAAVGKADAARSPDAARLGDQVSASIDFQDLDDESARQVHGGIDAQGRVSPYASTLLRNDRGRVVRIRGRNFPFRELAGTTVQVFIDSHELGTFQVQPGQPIELEYPLPAKASARPFLTLRFQASDYVYAQRGQHLVVFRLQYVGIES